MEDNPKLFFDWSSTKKKLPKKLTIYDETLRDGLQSTYIQQPTLKQKYNILKKLDELGIEFANIGFAVPNKVLIKEAVSLGKFAVENKLKLKLSVFTRTSLEDVSAAVEISQKIGKPLEIMHIVGTSRGRTLVEDWDSKKILKIMESTITRALDNNLEVNFLCEDGTRTLPEDLLLFNKHAIELGASRITVADTVGDIRPEGVKNIITFLKDNVLKNTTIPVDFHGHNDLGLATINSFVAWVSGASRIHTTLLGIGERAGNTSLHQFLLLLVKEGYKVPYDLRKLYKLSHQASKYFNFPILPNEPGLGSSVYQTQAGIHASSIHKAYKSGNISLGNIIYNSTSPSLWKKGARVKTAIGVLSGKHNVQLLLESMGITNVKELPALIDDLLSTAKRKGKPLSQKEIQNIINKYL